MKTTLKTERRLVLSANRRWVGLISIAAAPLVIWLGLLIVEEGTTTWFGWCFAALGPVMVLGGIWAMLMRLTLTLDRDQDMIRFSLHGITRRRNSIMKLSDLDHVAVRTFTVSRQEYSVLDIVPKPGSGTATITIREFWTANAADNAASAVRGWLGSAAGQ